MIDLRSCLKGFRGAYKWWRSLFMASGVGKWLYNLIYVTFGLLYPLYASLQALDSQDDKDDILWLTYWVVFSAFSVIEVFSDFFLSWLPSYPLAKICFLLWCCIPLPDNGSVYIYSKILQPFYIANKDNIDKTIHSLIESSLEYNLPGSGAGDI